MEKTLDRTFMHYGIRGSDMNIICQICEKNEVDFEWFKESILKEYHTLKMGNKELTEHTLQKLLDRALKNK